MKNKIDYLFALFLLGLSCSMANAQSSLNASGGNATGAGGSASYSVGQLAYTVASGNGGSSSAGVQQAFEIFTSSHEELQGIRLLAKAFPNPVETNLSLFVTDLNWRDLSYQLIDLSGKTLLTSTLKGETTNIPFAGQAVGIYTLRVVQGLNEIKSFKILKNQ